MNQAEYDAWLASIAVPRHIHDECYRCGACSECDEPCEHPIAGPVEEPREAKT